TLVAASADLEKFVGRQFVDSALLQQMNANDEGIVTTAGLDGIRRIFAYVRVPGTQARLAVGLDEHAVHSGIDRALDIAYLQLVVMGLFVLMSAWLGGAPLFVRPIRVLARTAGRLGRGDLHVRASQQRWPAEFEPLAIAFDDMARQLGER